MVLMIVSAAVAAPLGAWLGWTYWRSGAARRNMR